MSIKYVKGDAVQALVDGEVDFLVHCCNAQGKMGSGIAKQVRETFPKAFEVYYRQYKEEDVKNILGSVTIAEGVVNLVGQEYYGYDGKRYGHYGHIALAFSNLFENIYNYLCELPSGKPYHHLVEGGTTLAIPYKFASDRAGCDWGIILELIEALLSDHFNIIIYHLEDL